jgi:hypothetical protein
MVGISVETNALVGISVATNALVEISVFGWKLYSMDNNGREKDFRDKEVVPCHLLM